LCGYQFVVNREINQSFCHLLLCDLLPERYLHWFDDKPKCTNGSILCFVFKDKLNEQDYLILREFNFKQKETLMHSESNPFSRQSDIYAQYRPHYPTELYEWIVAACTNTQSAWDCATGNGQAAIGLAPFFDKIEASDISSVQIAQAFQRPNVFYSTRSAEDSGFADSSFDLIVVAQALHWFDYVRFWPEVMRLARPGAFFCAWGYSWLNSIPEVDANIIMPFRKILEPYWAPNNRILWEGYPSNEIALPFFRLNTPNFEIQVEWSLEQLIEYMCTWSAYKNSLSDELAVNALNSAISQVREKVAKDEIFPIRMPLSLVTGRIKDA